MKGSLDSWPAEPVKAGHLESLLLCENKSARLTMHLDLLMSKNTSCAKDLLLDASQ